MASEPSQFVLQKIRERQALDGARARATDGARARATDDARARATEEPEEVEEPDEDEDEEEEEEHTELAPPPKKSHHAIGERSSHRARSSSGSITDRASKFFKQLGPTQSVLLLGGGLLLVNHLMVPRGSSVLSQILNAIAPAPKARPRAYPSYYAGANWGAGWNHGNKPYGPWAHASPGGPSPYAHGESWWGW